MKNFIFILMFASIFAISCTPKMPHKSQKVLGKEVSVNLPIKNENASDTKKDYRVVANGTSADWNVAKSIAETNARASLVKKVNAEIKTAVETYVKQYASNSEDNTVDRSLGQSFQEYNIVISQGSLTNVIELETNVTRNTKTYEYTYWIALEISKEAVIKGVADKMDKISDSKKKEINYDRDTFVKSLQEQYFK